MVGKLDHPLRHSVVWMQLLRQQQGGTATMRYPEFDKQITFWVKGYEHKEWQQIAAEQRIPTAEFMRRMLRLGMEAYKRDDQA